MQIVRESNRTVEIDSHRVPGTEGVFHTHRTFLLGEISQTEWTLSHKKTGYAVCASFHSQAQAERFGKELWGKLSSRSKAIYKDGDLEVIKSKTPKRIIHWIQKTNDTAG